MLEKSKNMVNQTQFFRAAVNKIKIATSKPDSHQKKKKVVEEEAEVKEMDWVEMRRKQESSGVQTETNDSTLRLDRGGCSQKLGRKIKYSKWEFSKQGYFN